MQTEHEAPVGATSNREDFAELSRRVRDGGLLARRGTYYAVKIAATLAALAALVATARFHQLFPSITAVATRAARAARVAAIFTA